MSHPKNKNRVLGGKKEQCEKTNKQKNPYLL